MTTLRVMRLRVSMIGAFVVAAGGPAEAFDNGIAFHPSGESEWGRFGMSLASAPGVGVAGAVTTEGGVAQAGSVWVWPGAEGAFAPDKIVPTDVPSRRLFGHSVGVDEDVIVAGAPFDGSEVCPACTPGAAYLFDATTLQQVAKLTASDRDFESTDWFGWAVATDTGVAVVGAPNADDWGSNTGAAYLFDTTTGAEIGKLAPNDLTDFDQFGQKVAIDDGYAVVSAPGAQSVYVFDAATGQQLHKLTGVDSSFGSSVAVENGVAIVGARLENGSTTEAGAAYLFDVGTGNQLARLRPPEATFARSFGDNVAIGDRFAVVQGRVDPDRLQTTSPSDSVYVFDIETGLPLGELQRLIPNADWPFGTPLAMSGDIVLVGAGHTTYASDGARAMHYYGLGEFFDRLPGDFNGDGAVDAADYTVWRDGNFGGPFDAADANADGWIDVMDYNVWRVTFGDTVTPSGATVPEPTGAALALFAVVAVARRR